VRASHAPPSRRRSGQRLTCGDLAELRAGALQTREHRPRSVPQAVSTFTSSQMRDAGRTSGMTMSRPSPTVMDATVSLRAHRGRMSPHDLHILFPPSRAKGRRPDSLTSPRAPWSWQAGPRRCPRLPPSVLVRSAPVSSGQGQGNVNEDRVSPPFSTLQRCPEPARMR
jgi:hypothetical protein